MRWLALAAPLLGLALLAGCASPESRLEAAAARVLESEEVMLITNRGMLIRMAASGISVIGRNTQGVRLIALESKDEVVVGLAPVAETSAEAEAAGVQETGGELAAPVETAPSDEGSEGGEGEADR